MIACHVAVREALCSYKALISLCKFFHLSLFISEGFYNADPGKAVLDLAVNICNAGSVFLKRVFHSSVKYKRVKEHDNHNGKADGSHFSVYIYKNEKCAYKLDHRNNNVFRPMMKKLADVKKVACNSRQKMSYFLIVIKGKRKLLIVAENLISHVVLDICTHHMSVICNKIAASKLYENQPQHSCSNGKNS